MPHNSSLGPHLVMHRIECQHHAHMLSIRMKLNKGRNIVGLNTWNEIRNMEVPNAFECCNVCVGDQSWSCQRHACSFHERHLVRTRCRHRITQFATRSKIEF